MTNRIRALIAAAIVALTVTGCSGGGGSGSGSPAVSNTLSVATVGVGSDAAIFLANDKGYFAEEGIQVTTSVVANPPAGIAAAQSGQVDIAYAPSIPLINALSQGVNLKVVAASDGYPDDALSLEDKQKIDDTGLFARPDSGVTRPRELEGKSVAVPARNAQIEVTIGKVVKADGGDPAKINWLVLDPASALQALEQKRIDAAGLIAPVTAKAAAAGNVLIASLGVEFFERGAVGLWITGEQTAETKKDQLDKFARAIKKANAYANDNIEEAQEAAAEVTGTDLATVKNGAVNYWPATVTEDDLQRVEDQLVELGYLDREVDLNGVILDSAR